MLTLTLRSSKNGQILARIVEQNGEVYVLDFGDRAVIDDATQRIHAGFTVFRGGQLVRAAPRAPNLLFLLADFYAGEGVLVSVEEPLYANRTHSLETRFAQRGDELTMVPGIEDTQDLPTDMWSKADAAQVNELVGNWRDRAVRETWSPNDPIDLEPLSPISTEALGLTDDAPTEVLLKSDLTRDVSDLDADEPT
ncbi:MAG: hypothetical protein GWP91_22360 [Rhodobacterales bacterium]|nr:hypothetical protein [Rhodobacterales bacterium]